MNKQFIAMEYIVHGSKNQNDSKLKLYLKRCNFRSVSTYLGHSVSKNNIRVLSREQKWHRRKVKEAIYIKQQGPTMNRDQGYQLPPIYTQILPPVSGSSHRHAWPRSVVTDQNVASFQLNRSKGSFNSYLVTFSFTLIHLLLTTRLTMNDLFHSSYC